MSDHPITPPPELIKDWQAELPNAIFDGYCFPKREAHLCVRAAQWGADQELEACVKLLELSDKNARDFLYSARRPKPPSLKEQALLALSHLVKGADESMDTTEAAEYIRRALEQLDD